MLTDANRCSALTPRCCDVTEFHRTLFWIWEEQEAAEDDLLVVGVPRVTVSLLVLEGLEPNPLSSSELYDRAARQNLEHNASFQTSGVQNIMMSCKPHLVPDLS